MDTRRFLLLPLAAVASCLALIAGITPTNVASADTAGGSFKTICDYSHSLKDDPIVYPNQPGASHLHDFFGATTTNASSSYRSLQASTTTCRLQPEDTAAYWVPALYRNGVQHKPVAAAVYYTRDDRLNNERPLGSMQPYLANLRIIAGDSSATRAQDQNVTTWVCGAREQANPNDCTGPGRDGKTFVLRVNFPECWDGRNKDSANHKRHMAYTLPGGSCPSSHPVAVPRLMLAVTYPWKAGGGWSLSSGGVYSAHADFINAWEQATLERLTAECVNVGIDCRGKRTI